MRLRGKGRPRFGRGHVYTDSETIAAQNQIAWAAKAAGAKPSPQPCTLKVMALFKLPESWSTKKKSEMSGTPYTSKPDSDNGLKLIADALNGIAYHDDAQCYSMEITKLYGEEDWIEVVIEYDKPRHLTVPGFPMTVPR
jgi:Holliday junction resolvase RusA-like endonuclease